MLMKLGYHTLTTDLKIMASQLSQIGTRIIYLIQGVGCPTSRSQVFGGISFMSTKFNFC